MRLWIDNTSLHSVSRTLHGTARGEEDVSGLFHFAAQLVFTDSVELGCPSSDAIRDATAAIVASLHDAGVPQDVLRVWDLSEGHLAAAAERAAERLAVEVESSHAMTESLSPNAIATARPDFSGGRHSGDEALVGLLTGLPGSTRPSRTARHLAQGLGGAPLHMLAVSDSLWSAVTGVVGRAPWTAAAAWTFAIYLRCYLNQELANVVSEGTGVFVDYSPSVSRSRIVNLHTGKIIQTLSTMADDVARSINPDITTGSSIAKTLAARGKYEPAGILAEALRLRERAEPLRRYLHQVLHTADVERDYADILSTVGRLRNLLDRDVRRKRGEAAEPALRWQVICFVPVPVPEPRDVLRWLDFAAHRRRVAVLSEFARHGANPRLGPETYRRVEKNATRAVAAGG